MTYKEYAELIKKAEEKEKKKECNKHEDYHMAGNGNAEEKERDEK